MKSVVLACLLAIPCTAVAAWTPQDAAKKAVTMSIIDDTATPVFAYPAEVEFDVNGRTALLACGTVNVIDAQGESSGKHFYFVIFDKLSGLEKPLNANVFSVSGLRASFDEATTLPEDHPRVIILSEYAKCILKAAE